MAMVSFHAKSPIRVDLAGGTVDLWPIYLLLPEAKTINVGIDLWAEAWMTGDAAAPEASVRFESEDQAAHATIDASGLRAYVAPPALDLHARILNAFLKRYSAHLRGAWTLKTRAKSPAGAGLGGSSALGISVASALFHWHHGRSPSDAEKWELIELVRDVESGILYGPAGMQDYFGAAFGGLQKIEWLPAEPKSSRYSDRLLSQLESRLLVFYSGKSRNSGINNWLLYKNFIDRDIDTDRRFRAIVAATDALDRALSVEDWVGVGRAIQSEWSARRELASGISTPEMDAYFAEIQNLGIHSYKICGAGGGGCFFVYSADLTAQIRVDLESRATRHGFRPLNARCVGHGTQTEIVSTG